MKVGILGGTFDPVHNAHLGMARAALDALGLERILWIPTGRPGYRQAPVAPAADRLAMLRLALTGDKRFAIDERELGAQATGYTLDTLRALRAELGAEAELYLLLGADRHAAFGQWREPQEIARLAELAVFSRPGVELRGPPAKRVPMRKMAISGTDIRARAARGETLEGLVPPAVAKYIERHGLYR